MAIIVGDIHGNVEKVKAFLAHKPEEEHVALGDYVDSFFDAVANSTTRLAKSICMSGGNKLQHWKSGEKIIIHEAQPFFDSVKKSIIRVFWPPLSLLLPI